MKMNKVKALQKENGRLEDGIKEVYSKDYTDMIVYLRGAKINDYHQEEIRNDLVSLLLEGQDRGESLEDIFGQDKQAFIDDVIASVPKMNATENFLRHLNMILLLVFNFSLIFLAGDILTYCLERIVNHKSPEFTMTITWLDILLMIVIIIVSIAIVEMIVKGTYSLTDKAMRRRFIVYCLPIIMIIFGLPFLNRSLDVSVLHGPIWYYLPLGGLLALAKFGLSNYLDKTYNTPL
ncbi:hypothetical protein [Streptococcus parauberis]|uniref:hypothetical protein n=1 Tax=Streptococcus parauberis TaxID=1348 RepID=UPI0010588E7D|nr:hypothetical protein [Streptococcus parauberis]